MNANQIISIPDGPAFTHRPNKTRRVRVQGRAAGAGRFVTCIDVDSGEKLCLHVSKLPLEALPESLLGAAAPIPVC